MMTSTVGSVLYPDGAYQAYVAASIGKLALDTIVSVNDPAELVGEMSAS